MPDGDSRRLLVAGRMPRFASEDDAKARDKLLQLLLEVKVGYAHPFAKVEGMGLVAMGA